MTRVALFHPLRSSDILNSLIHLQYKIKLYPMNTCTRTIIISRHTHTPTLKFSHLVCAGGDPKKTSEPTFFSYYYYWPSYEWSPLSRRKFTTGGPPLYSTPHLHPTHTPSTIRLAQSPHLHLLRAGLHPRRSKGEKERAKVGWRAELEGGGRVGGGLTG